MASARISVRAIDVNDSAQQHVFPSLLAARKAVSEWQGKNICHTQIKRYAQYNKEAYGFRWELVKDDSGADDAAPFTFTFRECIEGIFNGGTVRVTQETPKRVSVFDLIAVVTGNTNPQQVFQRMCAEHEEVLPLCYNFSFPGAGQRATPVIDATGALKIVNLLPGKRALKFRACAMETLTRFLAGDQSLHGELDDNASHQAQLPAEHPMRAFSEQSAYANPKHNQFILHSPNMKGKYINYYYNKSVVYIMTWKRSGKDYIKIGWSDDFKQRVSDLQTDMPGSCVYSVYVVNSPTRIERELKNAFAAFNELLTINNRVKTELFTGISPDEVEAYLLQMTDEEQSKDQYAREIELKKLTMAHEIELKRLELQILQAQLALRA